MESGQGNLAVVDLERGTWRTVAEVPGFTRGLDFYGPLAFIGLSQVRETAIFSGIPLVERLREHTCGVWIVHIESGETAGFTSGALIVDWGPTLTRSRARALGGPLHQRDGRRMMVLGFNRLSALSD